MVHRQETVDCLKKFNARRKLKVIVVRMFLFCGVSFVASFSLVRGNPVSDLYLVSCPLNELRGQVCVFSI